MNQRQKIQFENYSNKLMKLLDELNITGNWFEIRYNNSKEKLCLYQIIGQESHLVIEVPFLMFSEE